MRDLQKWTLRSKIEGWIFLANVFRYDSSLHCRIFVKCIWLYAVSNGLKPLTHNIRQNERARQSSVWSEIPHNLQALTAETITELLIVNF